MGLFVRLVVFVGAVLASLVVVSGGFASSGYMTITHDTTLSEDHVGNIWIGADSVTLDCAGHTITPGSGQAGTGVGIAAVTRSNVTIRNCRVSGFGHGISLSGVTTFALIGNTSADNTKVGIALYAATGGTVSGNLSRDNDWWGISGQNVSDIAFSGNTATGNGYEGFAVLYPYPLVHYQTHVTMTDNVSSGNRGGFYVHEGADGVTLVGNKASGNVSYGFAVYQSNGNRLDHNVASDNGYWGFFFYLSSGNTFSHDVSNGNWGGFFAYASSGNTLTKNVANNNQREGFLVWGTGNAISRSVANVNQTGFSVWGTGNTISRCVGHANDTYDAYDRSAQGANTWFNNNFGSFYALNP